MRRYLLFLIFVLSFCCTSGAETRKLALLIGVDDYANVSSLECCVNDMKTLKEALKKIDFKEDDIQTLLTDANKFKDLPTKRNIERRISDLLSNAQPSDIVFIAFSGHGAQDGTKVYFCPPETEIEDIEGTCVSINKVMDDLANCKAKFKLMVVDACRSDPNQGPKGIGSKGWRGISSPPAGFALFQSCAEGEESWEDLNCGNSFFTKNLVAALSGEADSDHDGKLTLFEVCTWTTAQTKAQVKSSLNKSQKPYLNLSASDFALSENRNVEYAKEIVEEARKAIKKQDYASAIQLFDEALKLWHFDAWEREQEIAKRLLKKEQALNESAASQLQSTSRDSFEWEGTKIVKFIGNEKDVIIPEGTTAIGSYAFVCSDIETVIIPSGVTEMGHSAFVGCKYLTSVDISEGLTKIGKCAFIRCRSLTSISIPNDLSTIGYAAFVDCPELKVWRISSTHPYFKSDGIALLTKDGKKLIACPGAEGKYRIPEGVTEIGESAFNGCRALTSVVIPKSVTKIGVMAFEYTSLTSVVIPEGVSEIGYSAFSDCKYLTSVAIPKSVTKIKDTAFSGCKKLTIYAPAGSAAEEYAKKEGIPFQVYQE